MNEPEIQNVRLTRATILVLERLLSRTAGGSVWGFEVCRSADLDPGTVYPILARLLDRGWVSVTEEIMDRRFRMTKNGIQ